MKKVLKAFGIIILVAVIGFSTVTCNEDDGGNDDGNENDTPSGGTLVGTTVTDSNIGIKSLSGVVFGGGKFVANVDFQWSTSTDGVTWTVPTGTSFFPTAIAYGGGIFLAGGIYDSSVHMWRSSDGINWTDIGNTVPFGAQADVESIVYGNGKFVAGGTNGSNVVYSSNGGTTWNAVSEAVLGTVSSVLGGGNRAVLAIAYGGNKFVAGGNSNIAYSSDGGVTWTTLETGALGLGNNFSISAITYGGDKFVAVGSGGKIAYSSDGITWTSVENSPFPNAVSSIAYGGGKFVAGGYTGRMATSTDGVTWTALPDSTFGIYEYYNCTVNSIAYGNSTFVAVGYTDGGITGKMVCLK